MWPACCRRAAVRFLSFPRAGTGSEVELPYMGKNNGYPDLVCENKRSQSFTWST